MKKRLCLFICLIMCIAAVSGCSKEDSSGQDLSSKYDVDTIQKVTESYLSTFAVMNDAQVDLVLSQEDSAIASNKDMVTVLKQALGDWKATNDDLGAFVSLDDFELTEESNGVTGTVTATFEKRPMKFSITFDKDVTTMNSMSFAPVYTRLELMEKAGMNTLMGMGTVFCVLILISLIIYLFGYIPKLQEKLASKKQAHEVSLPPAPVQSASAAASGIQTEVAEDLELVAVITAAIAASEDVPADSLVVRSIRRHSARQWKNS